MILAFDKPVTSILYPVRVVYKLYLKRKGMVNVKGMTFTGRSRRSVQGDPYNLNELSWF